MAKILEQEALTLARGIDTMDPAQRPAALDILQRYKQQQDDEGLPEWPSEVQRQQDRQAIIRGLYTNGLEKVPVQISPWSQDPDWDRATHANVQFLQSRYGDYTPDRHDFFMADYAMQKWHKPDVDDKAFYSLVRGEIDNEIRVEGVAREGRLAAAQGKTFVSTVAEWQKANPKGSPEDLQTFMRSYWRGAQEFGPHQATAYQVLKFIESNRDLSVNGEKKTSVRKPEDGADFYASTEALFDDLAGMKPKDRRAVYASVLAHAEAAGYDRKNFGEQMLSYFVQGMDRMVRNTETTVGVALDKVTRVKDFADALSAPFGSADGTFASDRRAAKRYQVSEVRDEIRNLIDSEIDPMRPTLGWVPDIVETGLMKGPGAIGPAMAISATVGPWAAAAIFTPDFAESNRLELIKQGLDRDDAATIGAVAAPVQAAIESVSNLFQLGSFASIGKALSALTKPTGFTLQRYARNVALSLGTEFAEEQLQDNVVLPVTQAVIRQLNKDIPQVDWGFYQDNAVKQTPELLSILTPMALVFGGVMTAADVRLSQDTTASRDLLMGTGFSSSQAEEIAALPDSDARIAKARELWSQRQGTPQTMESAQMALAEQYRAAQPQIEAAREELQERMQAAEVSMRKVANGWEVRTPNATVVLDTHEEAFLAAAQEMERQEMTRDENTMRAFEAFSRAAKEGDTFTISDEALTLADAEADAKGRGAQDELKAIYDRAEVFRKKTGHTDLPLSEMRVLGRSSTEFREGVATYAMRINDGARAVDLLEEKAEADPKRWIAQGRLTRDALHGMIAQAQEATGDTYIHGDSDTALIEAYSDLARTWAMLPKRGEVGGIVKQEAREKRRRLKRAGGPITQLLQETMDFFREVLKRASRLYRAKKAGTLGDIETFLNESVGLTEEAAHVDAVTREVQEIQGSDISLPDSRAIPADASNVTTLPDGAQLVGPTTFSIRAYHGTPHKVDRFSTDNIGTGEGAQAYGWGLYFAEDRDVSLWYQRKLAGTMTQWTDEELEQWEADLESAIAEHYVNKDIDIDIWRIRSSEGRVLGHGKDATAAWVDARKPLKGTGNLYTVDLLPEQDSFLDWDKPFSQQSKSVQSAIRYAADVYGGILEESISALEANTTTGASIYSILRRELESPELASRDLAAAGIPGIRYLDGNSREDGEGTSNYVIFDESLVRIIEENGVKTEAQTTFSLALSDRLDALSVALGENMKAKPEARRAIIQRAQDKFSDAQEVWEALRDLGSTGTKEKMENDRAKARLYLARREAAGKPVADWQRKFAESEVTDVQAKRAYDKARLIAAMRALDAVTSVLPSEMRGKVGGFIKLAQLNTDASRIDEIERRFEKVGELLESHFRKELTEQVEKLFDRYRPERKSGEKPKGKLDPDAQELVDAAEAAMGLSAEEATGELGRIDALLADPNVTPEQEVQLDRRRVLVELFSDWNNADASRMNAALDALKSTASEGWAKWRIKQLQKREDRQEKRDALRADTGKSGIGSERDEMIQESAGVIGKSRDTFLNLSSFSDVLRYVFGRESKTARDLVDTERNASNQYEDAIQTMADHVQDHFTQLAGGVLRGEQMRFDMSKPKITVGDGVSKRTLSELQGIQALLMWQQEDGKRHMEGPRDENGKPLADKWAYDQAWIDELTSKLPPRALRTKAFLEGLYASEYGPLNALYRERHGVNLPQHKLYAPITVAPQQAKAGEMVDPVSGAAVSGSILTPGALRSRSRSALAEPQFRDALATFIGHNKQMEYWKAYYDFAVDAQAIVGNRSVMNSVEAKAGQEAVKMLRKWVESFAQGGMRDASAGMAITGWAQRMASRAATVGLLGRVSTLLVQSTQLAAASVQMPTGAYMLRFSKLLTGQLQWGDAVKSDFIQRRIKTAPPIVQQAMANLGTASRPNQITRAVRFLGNLLSGADGLFTGGTYAILLDWHRTQGAKIGLEGAELEAFAHQEATRATEEVAQPVRMGTRSMMEVTMTNPFAKAVWAYSSEARQKIALFAWAAQQGKADPARAAKAAFLTFIVGGLMSQIVKNLWREMKGDDDEGKWSAERLAKATLAAPLHGVPLVSELGGNDGLFSALIWTGPAFKRLTEMDYDDPSDAVRDISTILGAAGYTNDTVAGIASLSNAGVDFAKLLSNAVDDE